MADLPGTGTSSTTDVERRRFTLVAGVGVAALVSSLVSNHLSLGVNPATSPGNEGHPMVVGSAFLLATQMASAV